MQQSEFPVFREVQFIRQVWWVMLIVLGVTLLMWWGFYQQIILGQPWGSNPGPDWFVWLFWILFGNAFPIAFYFMRLEVEVYEGYLRIKYVPLSKREIAMSDIRTAKAISYQPIREYGGWGIRGWASRRAYTISGDRGVELTLDDGRTILIGSQKSQELALAIQARLPKK